MKKHTIMFMPQFHEPICELKKCHTIRKPRKRSIRPGDLLRLRGWEGKPYRSKQFTLREVTCQYVSKIVVLCRSGRLQIKLSGRWLTRSEIDGLAERDGFTDAQTMRQFWIDLHKANQRPFVGEMIGWFKHS